VPMSSALNLAVRSCSSTAVEGRYFNSSSALSAHALIHGLVIRRCRP
jgi:hypothetical protein